MESTMNTAYRRINVDDIRLEVPLPWDVFDSQGVLLLHKGYVLSSQRQMEALIARGVFADFTGTESVEEPVVATSSLPKKEKFSVLRVINEVNKSLETLLPNLPNEINAEAKILKLARMVEAAVESNSDIALACILLNQIHGIYPVRHCTDTAVVSILVARAMKKSTDEIMSITAAALTMNIGMLIYQEKLQQREGALSDAEFKAMRQHPENGVKALQQAGVKGHDWLAYVLHHHENEDGSGYPNGLSGADIPQNAKIIALADRYCARVSARNYRKSMLPNVALRDIFIDSGKSVDPMLGAYFIRELGLYPPGALVRLNSNEIGVVTEKGATATTPVVYVMMGAGGQLLASPAKRDTAAEGYAIKEALHEKKLTILLKMEQLWGKEAQL